MVRSQLPFPFVIHYLWSSARADMSSCGWQGRGRETHVPLMTKIKRTLGIRSTPRHERTLRKRV